jgi:uncharacterized protein with LGFP repeats
MLSLLRSFGTGSRSHRSRAARLPFKRKLEVERLEDLIALSTFPNLTNAQFTLNANGHVAELAIQQENTTNGSFAGLFSDPGRITVAVTGNVGAEQSGQTTTSLSFNGYELFSGVNFSGTLTGTGTTGRYFGNDRLSGSATEWLFLQGAVAVNITGNDFDPIQAKYQALGGASGFLGNAVTTEQVTPYNNGFYQQFQGGTIYWSPWTGAHVVYGAIGAEYTASANWTDYNNTVVQADLGLPTSDEMDVPGVTGARMNTFSGGAIYWSAGTGSHLVYGDIAAKYNSLGGPAAYGLPTAGEVPTAFGGSLSYNGSACYFQNGRAIFWTPTTGAHTVYGLIEAEYAATYNETDSAGTRVQWILGAPTSDEMDVPGVTGARMNTFQGGNVYWSPGTGAHVVYGAIGAKYNDLGGPAAYGLPITDEADVPSVAGARVSYFQGNRGIFWLPSTGPHTVYGLIGAEYATLAYQTDYYGTNVQQIVGSPTSDEMDVYGVPGARMNTLESGNIYWSPSTGAHVVYGAIGALYQSMGGPLSFLGLPTTDEQGVPGGRVSYFENGKIVWTPNGGAYAVRAVSQETFNTGIITIDNGVPVGSNTGVQLTVFADGAYHFVGDFHDSSRVTSYDYNMAIGLVSTSGVLYTFTHSGHVSYGDDSWDISGTSSALAAGWADLTGGPWYWRATVSLDLGALIQEIEDAAKIVTTVVAVVG